MKNKILPVALSLAFLSGCSSIVSKSDYPVAINSNPNGAKFVITNRAGQEVDSGTTPSTVTLKSSSGYFKGETYNVVLNKDGFSSKTYTISSKIDGWYFGNILLGGVIGMLIVDPATGAMYNLPDRVDVALDHKLSSASPDTLKIATIGTLNKEEIDRLEKIQ